MEAKDIRFGIELECKLPRREPGRNIRIGGYGYDRGVQIPFAPLGWVATSDSSIRPEDGYRTVEVVSPILQGEDGLRQVAQVVDALVGRGAITDSSCGLHIHVDGNFIDAYHMEELKHIFPQFEAWFVWLNGRDAINRLNNRYCNRVSGVGVNNSSRYQTINVSNWYHSTGKRTVEFRCWQGTTDLDRILAAIQMSVGLVCGVLDDYREVVDVLHSPEARFSIRRLAAFIDRYRIVPGQPVYDLILLLHRQAKEAQAAGVQS